MTFQINPNTKQNRHRVLMLTLGALLATALTSSLTTSHAIAASTSTSSTIKVIDPEHTAKAPVTHANSSTSNSVISTQAPTAQGVIPAQTQVYEGKHFRFYYPPAWQTGIQAELAPQPGLDSSEIVSFSYNGQFVLGILAIPRTVWNEQLPDEVPYGERIAATPDYIYAINLPQDSVYDPKSKEYPPFHKRVLTTEQVRLMFQGK